MPEIRFQDALRPMTEGDEGATVAGAASDAAEAAWANSCAEFVSVGTPEFLTDAAVRRYRSFCGLPESAETPLVTCAQRVREHATLVRLAWHAHRLLFASATAQQVADWPLFSAALGDQAATFYLLVAMSMVPLVERVHADLGVSADCTRATCRQVACFAGNYRAAYLDDQAVAGAATAPTAAAAPTAAVDRGAAAVAPDRSVGIFRKQLYWLRNYTDGRLFRLGRFEYMLKYHDNDWTLFHRQADDRYLLLATDGIDCDADGFPVANKPDADRPAAAFRTTFVGSTEAVTGHPVDPQGRILPHTVTLPLSEWRPAINRGDVLIDLHIPADGPMPLADCLDSMRQAVAFFAAHRFQPLPRIGVSPPIAPASPAGATDAAVDYRPPVGFWCHSWIFGPQLPQILPDTSNLVRYMHQLYLLPAPPDPGSLWFIFFDRYTTVAQAPPTNSLRRAVAAFLAGGGVWRGAGMFFPVARLAAYPLNPTRCADGGADRLADADAGCDPAAVLDLRTFQTDWRTVRGEFR